MSKVLYDDGRLAVVDYENDDSVADEKLIKTLLQMDEGNVGKLTRKMLGYRSLASFWDATNDDVAWQNYALSRADLPALERLGFDFSHFSPNPWNGDDGSQIAASIESRHLISVPGTQKKVLQLADWVQYLAKLHLLSRGDERHARLLPWLTYCEDGTMCFIVSLPWGFWLQVANSVSGTCARFHRGSVETIEHGVAFSVCVSVNLGAMGIQPFNDVLGNQLGLKRVAASALLSSLINCMTTTLPFVTDARTLELRRSDESSIAATMADLIIAGKIGACPHCGRPVLMPRKSSKPFCRPAHQTRYSEKARKMFNSGASVDEVASVYPYIQRGTIANW